MELLCLINQVLTNVGLYFVKEKKKSSFFIQL